MVPLRRRKMLIDVDTQKDLFLAGGSFCIRNHRRILQHIRRIMAWARSNNISIISTCVAYPSRNGMSFCVEGTDGQKKLRYTLLERRFGFPATDSTDLPRDLLRRYRQVIFQKRQIDPFEEPRIDRLLTGAQAEEFILIGATAEGAVLATALGLLQRRKKVTLIADAVGTHHKREAKLALRKMEAKGARIIEVKSLAGASHLKGVGACHCRACKRKKVAWEGS